MEMMEHERQTSQAARTHSATRGTNAPRRPTREQVKDRTRAAHSPADCVSLAAEAVDLISPGAFFLLPTGHNVHIRVTSARGTAPPNWRLNMIVTKAQRYAVEDIARRIAVSPSLFLKWAVDTKQDFSRIVDAGYANADQRAAVFGDFQNWIDA